METSVKLAGPHVSISVVVGRNIPHNDVDPPEYCSVYVTYPVAFTVNVRLLLAPMFTIPRNAPTPTDAEYVA